MRLLRGAPLAGRLTSSSRVLPDFLIIGAQRSGTTALFDALAAHPFVRPSSRKEVHYFDLNHDRGLGWYRAFFPRAGGDGLTGEATPYYLVHPRAAARAAAVVPDARLVAVLREPVERAWSHWRWNRAAGRERLSFAEALTFEAERLSGEDERLRGDRDGPDRPHQHYSYLTRGRYAEQLDRWRDHYPADALLVLRHDDLADSIGRVQDHLGLPRRGLPLPSWTRSIDGTDADRALARRLLGDHPQRLAARYGIVWSRD